ncbi:hypothetical protein ESTG_01086 [Escherichia coli B799]|uniref:hypothetical protein n=1 Tax=Escherichia coli TaxID=562 RepID=UPI00025CB25C|nr:hypothetical protein [Escherichia coli]EIG48533.1 hypothetical protein ESTG_01086 [Escherichia coli B799]
MESNIKGLVTAGHEMASELKAECGAVDMRSVAKLISDLATQLEVQLARANALAAENARCLFEISRCHQTVDEMFHHKDKWFDKEWLSALWSTSKRLMENTPATDAFLAEVRASAIEHAASERWGSGYVFDELNDFAAQLRKGVQS